MKRTHFFTLTELLVVIAIIGVLAGVALPVITTAANKGKQTQARTDMRSLELAFTEYERDFGTLRALPNFESESGDSSKIKESDLQLGNEGNKKDAVFYTPFGSETTDEVDKSKRYYDAMMEVLTYTPYDWDGKTNISGMKSKLVGEKEFKNTNPRRKNYFRSPAKMVTSQQWKDDIGYLILDPWGKRYNIAFDYNGDGKIETLRVNSKANLVEGYFGGEKSDVADVDEAKKTFVRGKILIFSYGHSKTDFYKNYVCSWKLK